MPLAQNRRVGFLIAGVQKGGTSSLWSMLAKHPQVARSRQKELHFFDVRRRDWTNPNYKKYERRFIWQPGALIAGEGTPSYVYRPGAMERIQAYNADMRMILSFRDPVERAFSQWLMEADRVPGLPAFRDAIDADSPTEWPRTFDSNVPKFAFVGRGYYGDQLAHVLELFPAEHVLLLDFHRVFRDLTGSLNRMTDLIGVERFQTPPEEVRRRVRNSKDAKAGPTEADIELLVSRYASDLARFGALSGLDISDWPTSRVISGSLSLAAFAEKLAGG